MATVGQFIAILVLILLALNLAAWVLIRARPSLLASRNEQLALKLYARYAAGGDLHDHVETWFRIPRAAWQAFIDEYEAFRPASNIYEDFLGHRHPPHRGRFVHIAAAGFRQAPEQGPWPPDPANLNIFCFGGSTQFGPGPDWTTIPHFLQNFLDGRTERPVRCYNFGRGGYFSTQEKILFLDLLARGHRPDVALFLDGINDFFFFDGRSSTYGTLKRLYNGFQYRHWLEIHAKTGRLGFLPADLGGQFLAATPLGRLLGAAADALVAATERPGGTADPDTVALDREASLTPGQIDAVIDRYLANIRQIRLVADGYGIKPLFVWQPSPSHRYDLAYHRTLTPGEGLGGHGRAGPGYRAFAERLLDGPPDDGFLWLADIADGNKDSLYVDSVHYTADFSEAIAASIGAKLLERPLVDRCHGEVDNMEGRRCLPQLSL